MNYASVSPLFDMSPFVNEMTNLRQEFNKKIEDLRIILVLTDLEKAAAKKAAIEGY